MRSIVVLLVLACSMPAQEPPEPKYPQPESNIPGPFTTYIVSGRKKGRFHCLVTAHELSPVVMVVVRGIEPKKDLREFLVKLDNVVDRNPQVRLAGFVVFLSDKIEDLARADDLREQISGEILKIRDDNPKLKNLSLALDTPKHSIPIKIKETVKKKIDGKDVEETVEKEVRELVYQDRYRIDDKTEVAVLLYDRYRTKALHLLKEKDLADKKKVGEILGQIAEKLNADR